MAILITGGTGYIGSHLALALLQAGYRVVLYDNLNNSSPRVATDIAHIARTSVPFVQADMGDEQTLTKTLQIHSCQGVVHCAGYKNVAESTRQPIAYYANNVGGSITLLKAMQASQINTLVLSSSASVYGEPHALPIPETHPTNPPHPYARTKLHMEQMLADYCAAHTRFRVVCLRYFNPAGAHDSGLIGEQPSIAPDNLMPVVTQTAAGIRPAVRVFGDDFSTPDGSAIRDYIHIQDLVAGHVKALQWIASNSGWHAINLGTGIGHSVLETIATFTRANQVAVKYQIAPRRSGDVAVSYACIDKAKTLLGWKPAYSLEDTCRSAWMWQQRIGVQH